nr:DUF1080 domain-containing protein [Alteromonas aestuariivivens]
MVSSVLAQDAEPKWKQAEKTEVWEPVPSVVNAPAQLPPSDALVLLGNEGLSAWQKTDGDAAEWRFENGVMTVEPGTGDILSKASFCDIQLHLEWRTPEPDVKMKGQQRNNSGVFLQQRYEVQILDSYQNPTYSNGQAASVYKQHIPLVNATRPPGEWQTYDIIYQAPRFNGEALTEAGYISVLHNGVLVQNHVEIQGTTEWIGAPSYSTHGCAPLKLQDHGNEVSFRNIWVRQLD